MRPSHRVIHMTMEAAAPSPNSCSAIRRRNSEQEHGQNAATKPTTGYCAATQQQPPTTTPLTLASRYRSRSKGPMARRNEAAATSALPPLVHPTGASSRDDALKRDYDAEGPPSLDPDEIWGFPRRCIRGPTRPSPPFAEISHSGAGWQVQRAPGAPPFPPEATAPDPGGCERRPTPCTDQNNLPAAPSLAVARLCLWQAQEATRGKRGEGSRWGISKLAMAFGEIWWRRHWFHNALGFTRARAAPP